MNLFQPISIAAACVLALSACASAPPAQRTRAAATVVEAPPPTAADSMIQPAATQVSAYGAANTGGTYPYGTAQRTVQKTAQAFAIKVPQQAPQQANSDTTEGVVVVGPDGTVWLRDAADDTAYQGDVDSCYAYARGQVAHDARIERDVASAFDSGAGGFGLTELRGRMSNFERGNRMPALFSSCMMAKGYNRQ
jgi:hypothetical protein